MRINQLYLWESDLLDQFKNLELNEIDIHCFSSDILQLIRRSNIVTYIKNEKETKLLKHSYMSILPKTNTLV